MEIKKKIKILLFLLMTYHFDCTAQIKKPIEITLLDKEMMLPENYSDFIGSPKFQKIDYSITNNSMFTYILIIDTTNIFLYSNIYIADKWSHVNDDDTDKQLFQMGIRIGNSGKFINTSFEARNAYFKSLASLKCTTNQNIIILKSGESIIRSLSFSYPTTINKTSNGESAFFFLLDDPEYFNIFLFQDKNIVMKNLNKKNKKKIKELKAKIYTGLIESNKIPVKLIE